MMLERAGVLPSGGKRAEKRCKSYGGRAKVDDAFTQEIEELMVMERMRQKRSC
jgi:hypothetical protein